ncbi:hypothetical protein [Liquorilactobacillus satsumensis]|uniref:hypothetical protein n=1 Tax=Liquorilactobacillus satsumensis TaxID=259059 RepID=UPI0039EA47E0
MQSDDIKKSIDDLNNLVSEALVQHKKFRSAIAGKPSLLGVYQNYCFLQARLLNLADKLDSSSEVDLNELADYIRDISLLKPQVSSDEFKIKLKSIREGLEK